MADILADIHRMPPVDTRFVAGRWHPHRISPQGFAMEARIWARALMRRETGAGTRFLVIGRARSGTTLLTRLLNGHSQIRCDHELLSRNVFDPVGLADRLARKAATPVYGFKLLSYQMVQVHRMRDPRRFLTRMAARGFRFIHLQRDTLDHCLSLANAHRSGRFHSDRPVKTATVPPLAPADFVARMQWAVALLAYEEAALAGFAPLTLSYEEDLMTPDAQAQTAARLFDWLGVPPEPVDPGLRRLTRTPPEAIVENWPEVAQALTQAGLGHLLPTGVA